MPDTSGLVVGGFHDLSWNLYRYPVDSAARNEEFALGETRPAGQWGWVTPGDTAGSLLARREPYKSKMTMDFVAGSAVVVPGYGASQGFVFVMSDLLEDNQLYASIGSFQGRQLGSIVANISANAVYVNQARRLNWGVGAFRTTGRNFEGDRAVAYQETAAGGLGLIRYPISRFSRVDGVFTFEHSDRTDFTLPVDEPSPGRVDRVALPELRPRRLALRGQRPHRRRALQHHHRPLDRLHQQPVRQLPGHRRLAEVFPAGTAEHLGPASLRVLQRRRPGPPDQYRREPGPARVPAVRLHRRHPGLHAQPRASIPCPDPPDPGHPFGDMQFPEIQAAFYTDVGKATFYNLSRDYIGSYGISFRMAFGPLAVIRLDVGRRFSGDNFRGYALDRDQRKPSYVTFFIGPNF